MLKSLLRDRGEPLSFCQSAESLNSLMGRTIAQAELSFLVEGRGISLGTSLLLGREHALDMSCYFPIKVEGNADLLVPIRMQRG